ncbi:MAG: ATPase/DNA packaging protein [Nitrosomonadaceae bacterium]
MFCKPNMDARLVTPFSMGVFASRLSGKSVFTKNLLLAQERMILSPFTKVIWVYKTWQEELFKDLNEQTIFEIEFLDDLSNFEAMGKQENTVIIIDDFMSEASNSTQVQALFTRGRHLGLSVIYLSQNLFHKGIREICH